MILVTGATGFLGRCLVARLLEEDGPDIVLPVRARDRAHARERVLELLATLYETPPANALRLRPVPAELTAPTLGLTPRALGEVTTVVHCAASVSFTQSLADARQVNVTGTANVLDLCHRLPALERVVHVSTAYVAGRAEGEFTEADHDVGQTFRNTYEQSKWEAERLAARSGLPLTIVRPSIVVGERGSGWTPSFNVIYWPLQAFARGLVDALPADPDGLVDLVPVDHVVDVLLSALRTDGVLHAVAGAAAPTVAQLTERAAALLGRTPPTLTPPGSDREHPAAVFAPYFDVKARFADAGDGFEAEDLLAEIIAYARTARWGRRPLSREAARARVVAA